MFWHNIRKLHIELIIIQTTFKIENMTNVEHLSGRECCYLWKKYLDVCQCYLKNKWVNEIPIWGALLNWNWTKNRFNSSQKGGVKFTATNFLICNSISIFEAKIPWFNRSSHSYISQQFHRMITCSKNLYTFFFGKLDFSSLLGVALVEITRFCENELFIKKKTKLKLVSC